MRQAGGRHKQPSRALTRQERGPLGGALPLLGEMLLRASGKIDAFMTERLGEEFAARLARVPTGFGSAGVDAFGLDPEWAKYALAGAAFLHRSYFRTEVFGIDKLPPGRVLLIANHSGQVPLDGALIGASLFMDAEPPRIMRAMVERWSQTIPFVSTFFSRVGQVVGVPENAARLLDDGEALLVFPEGARGISKTWDKRYQLEEFGLGFMRLALATNTPIVPVAVIGGEEQYVSLKNVKPLAKLLGMPSFPLLPQLMLPFGFLPLPTRYRLHFGEPLTFRGDADDDDAVIEQKVAQVQSTIQSMIHRGLKSRKSVFF